tara:strand:- start:24005 stop:24208 length:204 start_codon:yes stop_codon:yes gene_type:complete
MPQPAHPEIEVKLLGEDGNAFSIMGKVTQAMKRAGVDKAERDAYQAEAMSGDYDHLIQTTMRFVTVT